MKNTSELIAFPSFIICIRITYSISDAFQDVQETVTILHFVPIKRHTSFSFFFVFVSGLNGHLRESTKHFRGIWKIKIIEKSVYSIFAEFESCLKRGIQKLSLSLFSRHRLIFQFIQLLEKVIYHYTNINSFIRFWHIVNTLYRR